MCYLFLLVMEGYKLYIYIKIYVDRWYVIYSFYVIFFSLGQITLGNNSVSILTSILPIFLFVFMVMYHIYKTWSFIEGQVYEIMWGIRKGRMDLELDLPDYPS